MPEPVFGFIGAGRMATALAGGIVEAGLASATHITASDPGEEARRNFKQAIPLAVVTPENAKVVANSDVVVLAVKPQTIDDVLKEIAPMVDERPLLLSIAAGIPLERLERALPPRTRVVRVMPNTPCLVRRGASGYSLGSSATRDDAQLVGQILSAVGISMELPEQLLDVVTGLSGSGPAFVYTMIEAMASAGMAEGLTSEQALQLAASTVAGGAAMVLETQRSPADLREAVTSPGGTTLAGLAALEQHKFREAVVAAVAAATRRSTELGAS
jgi:pyrroline-5-carboxylate reductase